MTPFELFEHIDSFESLKQGWDSRDGKPIAYATRQLAKCLVPVLPWAGWFVSPCPSGAIVFEHEIIGKIEVWAKG